MPQYEIQIPGKGTFEVTSPEPLSDAQAYMAALQQASAAPPPQDKTGFMSSLGAATRAGFGEAASGIGSLLDSEGLTKFGQRQQEKAAQAFTPTSEKDIEAASERGMIPEAGAYFKKYVSEPAGQAIGSLLGRYGAPIAGGAAAAAFAPEAAAIGTIGAGTVGFAATNAPIHIGENIARQKEQGQAPDYMSATVAGLGQAALDSLGGEILAGPMRGILGKTAVEQATPLAKRVLAGEITSGEAAAQLSGKLRSVVQSTAQNAAVGTGMMVGDEALRRAAANQGITDPEAIKTYIEQAKAALEVAPLFGLAHGLGMPGKGRDVLARADAERMGKENAAAEAQAAQDKAAADAQAAQTQAAEAARRQTPEFAQQAATTWNGFQQQLNDLVARTKTKVDPNDLMAIQDIKDAKQQIKDLKKSNEFQQAFKDFRETTGVRAKLKEQQDAADAQLKAQQDAEAARQSEAARQKEISTTLEAAKQKQNPAEGIQGYQERIPGLEPMETENVAPAPAVDVAAKRSEFLQKQQELEQLMEAHQQKESDALAQGDIDAHEKLRPQRQLLANEQDYIKKQLDALGATPVETSLDSITTKLAKKKQALKNMAGEGYDPVKADKLIAEIRALEESAKTAQPTQLDLEKGPDGFGKATKEQVSESTKDFNLRTYEPQGYNENQQASLFDQPYADYLGDQEQLDKMRKEGVSEAELTAMEKKHIPQGVTEQLDMFGHPLAGGVVTGEKAAAPKSRAELVAELRIARVTGNRAAASELVEKIRDMDAQAAGYKGERKTMDTKGLTQAAVPFAKPAMPGQQPLRTKQQQAYADARAKAYADMVAIVSKYNQGKAKLPELESARKTLVENLIGDIEATRGSRVEDTEAQQIRRQANELLHDLVTRFGDTRNLSQKGRALFIPSQDSEGRFTSEGQYPTVESRAPGKQTFANPHAASLAIKEGLDAIRNKAVSQGTTTAERTITPDNTTKEALQKALAAAEAKNLPPEQARTLEQIQDSIDLINADTDKRNTAAEYVYRASNGLAIDPALAKDVKALFTKSTDTARQLELNNKWGEELRGRIFNTPEEFERFLAGDALQQMRSNMGIVRPTLARLAARTEPFVARAKEYAAQIEALDKQYQQMRSDREAQLEQLKTMSAKDQEREYVARADAETKLREAEGNLKTLVDKLDKELHGLQAAYIEAEQALSFSVKTSEDITKAIEKNRAGFEKNEADTLNKLITAKETLSGLMDKYTQLQLKDKQVGPGMDWSTALGSFKQRPDVIETQKEVGRLTKKLREQLARDPANSRVMAFLDKDLDLQMQFEDEMDMMDVAAKQFDDARTKLYEAKQKQDRSTKNKKALKEANAEIDAAKKASAETESSIAERKETVRKLEEELGVERVTGTKLEKGTLAKESFEQVILKSTDAEKELTDQLAALRTKAAPVQRAGTGALEAFIRQRDKAKAVREETQLEREERDKVQKRLENEQTERLKAIPGEKISFEGRRKLLETLDATPERLNELDDIIHDPKSSAKEVTEAEQKKKSLEAKADSIAKLVSNDPELHNATVAAIDKRIEKVKENIGKVTASLQKKAAAKTITSRKKELAKYKQELRELELKRETKRGVSREALNVSREKELPSEPGALEQLRSAYEAAVKDGATEVEYQGKAYPIKDIAQALAPRKMGPIVKKTVTAGNIRTGDTSTSGERMLATRNKPTQAGTTRPVTSLQAQRGAAKDVAKQQAEKRMDEIDAMRPKIAAAIDKAEAENDTTRFENLKKLENAHAKEYEQLEKTMSYIPKPTKGMTAAQIAEQKERVRNRVGEEKDLYQTTQEGEAVPLSEQANSELKRGSVAGALADVADNSKDELNRTVAQRLKMLLGETKATIDDNLKTDEGIAAHGAASTNGREIWLNGKTGLNEETLLHESVHAATERILKMPEDQLSKEQLAAKRELQALHEAIQNDPDITSADAKGNLSEFVAEALSNKELQDQLRNKKWTLKNAWNSFKKIIMDMLGIKVPENMLDATLASADTLFARPEKLVEPQAPTKDVFRVAKYDPKVSEAGKLAERLIATQRPLGERLNANAFGRGSMEFMVKMVDQYAPLEKISKQMDALNGTQMMHYLRMVGQRMNLLGQAVGVGAPELKKITRADGRAEWVYQAKEGPSLVGVAKALQPANQLAGSPEAANNLFSLYSIAKRAESVGLEKLNYKNLTQAQVDKAMAEIKAVPGLEATFKNAHAEYEKFNRNMVQFGVDTGVFSKEMAQKMTQNGDYVPYYRENGDGSISMMMGNERIQNMGNVKDQPYLHELVGGDQRIADFMTSSVNNANMILEMGLRNQATKNVAFELEKLGMAKIGNGNVRSGPDVIKYKLDGKDKFAVIENTPDDIPPELLVKGMEGIPVQTSALLKLAGIPSRVLREMFVANPISAGRILFKDTISSAMTSGSNFDGIRAAMRNVGDNLMERRGISGGEVYTGLPQDLTKILRQVQSGKPGWESLLAKANVLHAKADAMTRQIRYESYLKQGLSEMEANHMALESMNFTRRGISPSIHVLNTLHPFLNSQIQGLNTLIKAIRGNMPLNEKLRIREKIIKRGMLLGAATMLYSSLMQDDETYQNALPEQKYNNFFVPFPGLDEKVRVPIPFEAGIMFKSIPEALMNYMYGHDKEAAEGMRQAVLKLIPGGESYGVPQILLPGVETALGKSLHTGRDIESRHEQSLAPGMRTRESTTGLAAELGELLNISPVKLDHLIGGYTGQLGLTVTQMASSLVFGPKMAGPEVAKHWSQEPLIGSTFQPKDAGAVVEDAYQMMTEASQVKATYQDLLKKGKRAEAEAYLNKNAEEYAKSGISSKFTSGMTQFMNAINATKLRTDLTPEQKMQEIDKIKAQRTSFAEQMKAAATTVGKTTPQPALQ